SRFSRFCPFCLSGFPFCFPLLSSSRGLSFKCVPTSGALGGVGPIFEFIVEYSSRLLGARSEDEGQDALHSDRRPVEDCRFEDPFTRRFYGRAPQRKVTADCLGLDDKPRL